MADILHRVGVEHSSPQRVYDALTTLDGLSGWWVEKTTGDTGRGGVVEFRFGPGGIDMEVAELDPGRLVRWDVVDGPQEWIGTSVQWDIRQDGDWTIVLFRHEGWREPVEFMHHCSTKWATFLMSLKELLETGTGAPDPRDVRISDWH
ncbi:SRPBCC family protein [Blastococcus goldschmidtiae]|uniref:SRPBCC domain-containing protein n=1 Tax=Blastococcus goldschmidtiae TaxID=3075546 RepID=A0ABU2K337_9ACTN|nr:SRPBCC domain-containing protein [Blastococcus sp. DSM 46792]MDT0274612.1 SRPBCC domain-containing protein [Blastococcus sp. DSM 46792]